MLCRLNCWQRRILLVPTLMARQILMRSSLAVQKSGLGNILRDCLVCYIISWLWLWLWLCLTVADICLFCSSMVPGSRNPMWGEEFNFSVDELPVTVIFNKYYIPRFFITSNWNTYSSPPHISNIFNASVFRLYLLTYIYTPKYL